MNFIKVKTEILQDMASGYCSEPGFELIENQIFDHGRWSIQFRLIFKTKNKFYQSYYSRGATEYQDESPYEGEDKFIECQEVRQIQIPGYEVIKDE